MPRIKKSLKPRRRTRGEGTVYQKVRTWKTSDGATRSKTIWVAAVSEGQLTEGGRSRRQRKFFYGDTATAARNARDAYLREKGNAVPVEPPEDRTTVAEFTKHFLEEWERRPTRQGRPHSPATLVAYEKTLRLHVLPYIGAIKIIELTDSQIKALYTRLEAKSSRSMIARVHTCLRVLLNFAIEEKLIDRSPLATIRRSYKRPQIEPLTEKQVAALLKAAKGDRIAEALITVAIDSGMRQGELLALRWRDIDFRSRTINVFQAASEVAGEITLGPPKSGAGRAIEISSETVAALRRRMAFAKREGLEECELVFPSERGFVLWKSNLLREVWGPIRKEAGVEARFHDLRHTCATMLLKSNVHPKVVQERLGHASITLTMDTYSAFVPSMQSQAANALGKVLGRLKRAKGK